jgi:iron(III) transport system substrate-binding protein
MMRSAMLGIAVAAGLAWPAQAQLVIDGETIADAKTLDAARTEGRAVIFSTYASEGMRAITEAFEKDTGIKLEVTRLPGAAMFQRAISEFAAGKLEADWVDVTDISWAVQLADRGIFTVKHKVPSFDQIPPETRDAEGRWYSIVRPASVIGVNLSRVPEAEAPKSWKDLLNPKWKGMIGTPNIDSGGSMWTMYSFLREKVDPDFWKKFAPQVPKQYPSIAPVAIDLARGEIAIGLGPLAEQTFLQMQAGAPLKVVFPTEGISSFPGVGGITPTAKNPNAAAVFLNWMTSKHGGNIIGKGGAYPANSLADPPEVAGYKYPPVSQVFNLKMESWTAGREAGMKEWRETFALK